MKERVYSVLVVSAAEKLNTALSSLMPESHFEPVRFVTNINAARRAWGARRYDHVIVNSPLKDDTGIDFALDIAESRDTVVLLLVRDEIAQEIRDEVVASGVFMLSKPVSVSSLSLALDWLASARENLRKVEKKTLSVEEKMEEIRVVNRAKWLLISELKMEEPEAHRYIEKQAMDRCIRKKEVAEEIIRTYT